VGAHVFEEAGELCKQIAEHKTAQFIFLKLPLQAKFPGEFNRLHENMKVHWTDITNRMIDRRLGATYTIVCALRKAPSPANTQDTHRTWGGQTHMHALLTQLHA
jgi:hypothetical protein